MGSALYEKTGTKSLTLSMILWSSSTVRISPDSQYSMARPGALLRPLSSTPGGSIEMRYLFLEPGSVLLHTIRIGNLVQQPLPTGNGMSVKVFSKEDLPHD